MTEQEDKKLLEDWASFQKDISDDTYRTATYGELRELLAAQARISFQEGLQEANKYQKKPIPNFPNYSVDTNGIVFGTKDNVKIPSIYRGYFTVKICNEDGSFGKKVHRLVLETFVGPCPLGMEACHFDGNRQNNRLENLRWATSKENNLTDKLRQGRLAYGEKMPNAKLNEMKIRVARHLNTMGWSWQKIADFYGVSETPIYKAAKGATWKHVFNPTNQ